MPAKITMYGEVYHNYVGVGARLKLLDDSSSDSSNEDSSDDEVYQKQAAIANKNTFQKKETRFHR